MGELSKIREVTLKYNISARALKYYEDMALIQSTKSDDYAYRLYDENAITRLEQILILRKLNIKIKDIQRIFDSKGSEVVLEVLQQKTSDIDCEISLLYELKDIVLEFIKQIKKYDFHKDNDIKMLFNQAQGIEQHIINIDYEGNISPVNRLFSITERLEKLPDVRIICLEKAKIVSSTDFHKFDKWLDSLDMRQQPYHQEYMWFNRELNSNEWFYIVPKWLNETGGFDVSEFPGGLYAVASCIGFGSDDLGRVYSALHKWVRESEYYNLIKEENDSDTLAHVIGEIYVDRDKKDVQLDLYVPIVEKII